MTGRLLAVRIDGLTEDEIDHQPRLAPARSWPDARRGLALLSAAT
jgi:hypothetical protein